MAKDKILPIKMVSFDSASLSPTYQSVNAATNGLPFALVILKIVNDATTAVTISYNGVDDHDYAPLSGQFIYDYQTNKEFESDKSLLSKGTQVYVKGTAGVGTIKLIGWYIPQ